MFNETKLKKRRFIEEIVLFLVLALSLIGMGITDFSPLESHRYWTLMIILLAFASIGLAWSREEYQGNIFKILIIRQVIHWGATLITVTIFTLIILALNDGLLFIKTHLPLNMLGKSSFTAY